MKQHLYLQFPFGIYTTNSLSAVSHSHLDQMQSPMHGDESEGSLNWNEPANCDQQFGYSCPKNDAKCKQFAKRKVVVSAKKRITSQPLVHISGALYCSAGILSIMWVDVGILL